MNRPDIAFRVVTRWFKIEMTSTAIWLLVFLTGLVMYGPAVLQFMK